MYKAAVMGLGKIGLMYDMNKKTSSIQSHTLAYASNPHIRLLAGCDLIPEREQSFHQLAPHAKFYNSPQLFIQEIEADIISICTPAFRHLEDLRNILRMEKPPRLIFCEKPIVSNRKEITELKRMFAHSVVRILPNLSRRWQTELQKVRKYIEEQTFGPLDRVNIRYTRGIHNTGAHMIDIVSQLAGKVKEVRTLSKTPTSADLDEDYSYSFEFQTQLGITGFAEPYDDRNYYVFEFDLYFTSGKIEIRISGDSFFYYKVDDHPLFPSFKSLHLVKEVSDGLSESTLQNAVQHMVNVFDGKEELCCGLNDGFHPVFVAEAIEHSYEQNAKIIQVLDTD